MAELNTSAFRNSCVMLSADGKDANEAAAKRLLLKGCFMYSTSSCIAAANRLLQTGCIAVAANRLRLKAAWLLQTGCCYLAAGANRMHG